LTLTALEGVSYHGTRETRHTDWSGDLQDDHYGPGQVWEKIFPAGAVEMRGNNGGDGSYVMFASALGNAPSAPRETGTTSDGCLTSNYADGENPTTAQTDPDATAAIRCCGDDGSCQTQDLPGSVMGPIFGVDGVAVNQNQACINSVTFAEAEAICAEAGRRLCSVAELNSGVCCGTGCWHDHRAVWTQPASSCGRGIEACREIALSLGLTPGGVGYDFTGDYGTKGCYAYSSGQYAGHAYYGLLGGGEVPDDYVLSAANDPQYRPAGSTGC